MKYQIIKERRATYQEVFDNLKYGGLKLLFENHKAKSISQVAWSGNNQIEIITIKNDKVFNQHFMTFSPGDVHDMILNYPVYVNSYGTWYIGYIKD